MSIFGAITHGAKALLGFNTQKGPENVMKIASGIGNWIDEQKLTDQERLEFTGKVIEHFSSFMQSTVGENTERSITRREIAIWVIRVEAIALFMYGILATIGSPAADVWWKIAVDSPWGLLTLGVGAFFFGTHLIRATQKN